jgi:hypothetical protein
MFPIPTEDRSIHLRFGKAVRYKPSLIEGSYDGKAETRVRDGHASQFARHPTHVLWSHLSKPDSDYNPGSRKHVTEFHHEAAESKKRSKYQCTPLPDEYLKSRIMPSVPLDLLGCSRVNHSHSNNLAHSSSLGGNSVVYGLAEGRPEVSRLASKFELHEFKLNMGEHPRSRIVTKPRDVDPVQRASSNPLVIGDDVASIKLTIGKRPLELPRSLSSLSDNPPTFSSSPSFGKYSEAEHRGGKKFPLQDLNSGAMFDPLFIKATNAGRSMEHCPPDQRSLHFMAQQDELVARLRDKRI